jgi:MFS family permease
MRGRAQPLQHAARVVVVVMRRWFAQPADETPLDWRAVAAIQALSTCSIAATTALFSIAYFMSKRFDPLESEQTLALRAGMLTAMKPAFAGLTSFAWGSVGDAWGFERVMIVSGVAHAGATAAFAFSDSWVKALALRALQGAVDGMVTLQKPALALVSDGTNAARAFSTTGVAYGAASAFSPALAALLSEPCDNWEMFQSDDATTTTTCPEFLEKYPFFLANAWVTALAIVPMAMYLAGWLRVDAWRREESGVVVELELLATEEGKNPSKSGDDGDDDGESSSSKLESAPASPPWWRDRNVRMAIASQVGCTFVVLVGAETTPIWMATSVSNGGLGWTSTDIGAFGTVMGMVILTFQITLFTRLCRRYGIVTLLTYALLANALVFPLHPIAHTFAKSGYPKAAAWAVIVALGIVRGMSGPIIMGGSSLILNNSAPRDTIGAVNGFVGTFANAARAMAPILGGALVAMMVGMGGDTPGRVVWPFVLIAAGFLALTLISRRLSPELNTPTTRRR